VKSNPLETRIDRLRIGGDFGSIGVGLVKPIFLLQQIDEQGFWGGSLQGW